MGYLSSVRIAMSEDAWKLFQKLDSDYLYDINPDDIEEDLLNYITVNKYDSKTETRYIGWDCIKWYKNFDNSVDAIEYACKKIKDSKYSISYIRIGEQYGDIDQWWNDAVYKGNSVEVPQCIVSFDDNMFDDDE